MKIILTEEEVMELVENHIKSMGFYDLELDYTNIQGSTGFHVKKEANNHSLNYPPGVRTPVHIQEHEHKIVAGEIKATPRSDAFANLPSQI